MDPNTPNDPNIFRSAPLSDAPSWISGLLPSVSEWISDRLHPRRIQMTATPVAVGELWTRHSVRFPMLLSACMYAGLIFLLWLPWRGLPPLPTFDGTSVALNPLSPLRLNLPPSKGGGSGGHREPTPASFGVLPRADTMQFVPPTVEPPRRTPSLAMDITLVAPDQVQPVTVNLLQLGNPLSLPELPLSNGRGGGAGIGNDGDGHGIGDRGKGPGFGDDMNTVGGIANPDRNPPNPPVFVAGSGGVSTPKCTQSVEPEYSEEARKARYQGVVLLAAVVRKDGSIQVDRVLQNAGMGLDDNAIAAVRQWRCTPAVRDGIPVDARMNIQVRFTLH